jgi:hypothetical protein
LERFWPVGGPAENIRAMLKDFGYKNEKDCKEAAKMLDGTYEPENKDENIENKLDDYFEQKF